MLGRFLSIFIISIYIFLSPNIFANDIESQDSKTTLKFYKLSDIPINTTKTIEELEKIESLLIENQKSTHDIHQSLSSYSKAIDGLLNNKIYENMSGLTIRFVQKKSTELLAYTKQLTEWNEIVTLQIDLHERQQKHLSKLFTIWKETKLQADKEEAPEAIADQLASVISKIENLQDFTKEHFDSLLTDANTITTQNLKIKNLIQKLQEKELKLSTEVFEQNEPTFFTLLKEQSFAPVKYFANIYKIYIENFKEFSNYIDTHQDKIWILITVSFIIFIFVFYFNYLYRKKRLFIHKESLNKRNFFFIGRAFSTFLILVALSDIFIFSDMPSIVNEVHLLFILIPIFRIIQVVTPKAALRYFYIFFSLYILFLIQKNGDDFCLDGRIVMLLLNISIISFNIIIIRDKILNKLPTIILYNIIYGFVVMLTLALVVSIIANIYGAILLSAKILESVFIIYYASLIFYALSIILTGYIIIILRRHMASATNLVEKFSKKVEKTTIMSIRVIMFLWWFKVMLVTIGIYPYLLDTLSDVLSYSWVVSNTTISIQSIVDFILIVVITIFLSRFLTALLEIEIFSRFTLPRGLPTAIKTVLNYIIIISGVVIALSSLGVSTEQFALVFGALSVGIGFGLRNIIANFVSGIIMVFERPVQIGDTIQIQQTMGTIKSIGARSSTIQTFDGSEVIIPNADFIAKEITNWTLSDKQRRKTLEFKVDFDSDIQKVMQIMLEIAKSHENILKDPEPLATFNGFGEYYLNFKLYFWLTENIMITQSDIAIGIYNKLKQEGIKMPIPHEQIKILR